MRNVPNANGLKWDGQTLFVLANTELWAIDRQKKVTVIARGLEKAGDGLERLKNGDFIVTCWAGLIYHVKTNGEVRKILDVQGQMNTADLAYDGETDILYVPTFNHSSVIAYRLLL
jgi:hypothetical protein